MSEHPPSVIYLQWFGSSEPDDPGEVSESDVSWCRDKIWDHDFEYRLVKKRKAKKPKGKNRD